MFHLQNPMRWMMQRLKISRGLSTSHSKGSLKMHQLQALLIAHLFLFLPSHLLLLLSLLHLSLFPSSLPRKLM
jgi:hypothetical protein